MPNLYKPHPFEDEIRRQVIKGKVQDMMETLPKLPTTFNEPTHYHQGQMDTIEFLQKGFPPEVCMGFFLGNVIKYAQRANYKNGVEDFEKMVDYANRALDWYKRRYVE